MEPIKIKIDHGKLIRALEDKKMNIKERNAKSGIQTRNEVYMFYVRYFKEYGYAPSYKEVAESVGIAVATAKRQVTNLIEMKYLETNHPGESRAIRVTGYEFKRRKTQ